MRRLSALPIFLFLLSGLWFSTLSAQDNATDTPPTATPVPLIPDLAGLTLPQAAAELTALGLQIGVVEDVEWNEAAGDPNTISEQTPSAGEAIGSTAVVDVQVSRIYNIEFLYDNNDLNLHSLDETDINIAHLQLVPVHSTENVWAGRDWSVRRLEADQCLQILAFASRSPITDIQECDGIQRWFATRQVENHFWLSDEASEFLVIQDGIVRATCPTTTATTTTRQRCLAYLLSGDVSEDTTAFAYFVYDDTQLFVVNRSSDAWMPVNLLDLTNIDLFDPAWFDSPPNDALLRLAPGHCLRYGDEPFVGNSPLDCAVIADIELSSGEVFWRSGFRLTSRMDDEQRECPEVGNDSSTVCFVPR